MKPNLLTFLALQCQLEYVSDLTLSSICKANIEKISMTSFSLEEWNDAVRYLCKRIDLCFKTIEEAKQYLKEQ